MTPVYTQEPVLFATTIRENILFGKPNASNEEVVEAARLAHIDEFVSSLPDGYDTQVGNAGSMISVGQKQRICLARVLIANHKILLLDEATSALDAESELMVQAALENVLRQKRVSTIVIAHRLSTIRNASKINVIVHGRVEESGTHEELMASNTYYRRLVEKQEGSENSEATYPSTSPPNGRVLESDNQEALWVPEPVSSTTTPHIEFNNISFSYPSRPHKMVLQGFNLTLQHGETVALVGELVGTDRDISYRSHFSQVSK
jgi:ATP-binding cassette, subfamily B (MDR/TAP), member 1